MVNGREGVWEQEHGRELKEEGREQGSIIYMCVHH